MKPIVATWTQEDIVRLVSECAEYKQAFLDVTKERDSLRAELAALREAYEKEKAYGIKRVKELLDELHEGGAP